MKITEYIKKHTLYLDGGMGTLLQANGLTAGELPELWNLTHRDTLVAIQKSYFDAGSNVVNTNTFGANSLKFSREELEEIIKSAIEIAKEAAEQSTSDAPKWVALDIGPTGRMLAPYGDLDFEDAVGIFAETVRLGAKHGADLVFIETMSDSYETKAALLAAKENCDLPVFVSNAYGKDGKLMTGANPHAMVTLLEGMGADAIGVNCSLGPKALSEVVDQYLTYASVPVLVKPNAGLPKVVDGKTVYDVYPEEFSEDVAKMIQKGVRAAGGCCGTTPEYIAALVAASKDIPPLPLSDKEISAVSSYTHAVAFGGFPILIGERINPTGKKRFKEALRNNDMDYILKEGLSQEEHGAHILDVNVGLPEINEPEVLTRTVRELQAVTALPLQIDTSDPVAMEKALRRYNGKAMINSVNGKLESMESIFPLAKKYGGLIVALTLDENGIPKTAEERLAIAEKIVAVAGRYGIPKKEIIFDPLAMTVSADKDAALETLKAIELIRTRLGCLTSLGVSNVSFGLPMREAITSVFFSLALERGLSAAIMNPYSYDMKKAYFAFRALHGLDENCADYIGFASTAPVVTETSTSNTASANIAGEQGDGELQKAIIKGLRDRSAMLTRELLSAVAPLEIVNSHIIPALNTVGEGFEKKTVYLPQLLMSAEAAKAAFEVIKEGMSDTKAEGKYKIILTTVKGDIHDIGKNIVKLILENYGYEVYDLGKDVSPEEIVRETVRLHAPVVGLSALMTTTVPAMEETIKQLRLHAPWCKVIVGGAVLNEEYAAAIGADKYASDAMEGVRYAESLKN